MPKKRITVEKILEALPGTGGIELAVANKLKCSRVTINVAKNKSPTLLKAFRQEKESLLDLAESKLLSKIQAGDNTMIIFFLKTQGKARGYIERQETADVSVSNPLAEELKKLRKSMNQKKLNK